MCIYASIHHRNHMPTSRSPFTPSAGPSNPWAAMNDSNSPVKAFIDAGWFAGFAIILLQLTSTYLPVGEWRDWLQYFMVGGVTATYLAISALHRIYPCGLYGKIYPSLNVLKCALSAYAVLALTYYFIVPLFQEKFWWLWLSSALIALRFSVGKWHIYPLRGISVMWLLLCSYALFFTLMFQSQTIRIPTSVPAIYYGAPFIVSLLFIVAMLCRKTINGHVLPLSSNKLLLGALHLLAFYTILLPTLRTDGVNDGTAIHHSKAFLEFAASVRAGGWLLWDTPSQYGFMQTMAIAFLPAATAWQSFYLLNGGLQLFVGFAIFAVLFAKYRSLLGFVFSLSLAVACSLQMVPGTITMIIYPSTGVIRFFWVYAMVAYVFYFCFRAVRYKDQPVPTRYFMLGNCLWLFSALWSVENSMYVSVIWLPSLFLIACGEISAMQPRANVRTSLRHLRKRLLPPIAMALALFTLICAAYLAHCGSLPDFELLTAYTSAYQTFMAYPMKTLAILPCWLGMFFMLAMFLRNVISTIRPERQSGFQLAALYSAAFSIWACGAYYVPFSENFHITGTLSLLVFNSALTLLLIPSLAIPTFVKLAFEKAALCLYAMIIMGTASHFDYGVYTRRDFLSPINSDVTRMLPPPAPELQALIVEAGIPDNASVQVITARALESTYITTPRIKPWLLPNVFVGFSQPLSPQMYKRIAERRAKTTDEYGWVIEANDLPLEALPWLNTAIVNTYAPVATFEKGVYRIRKYRKL